MKPKPALNLAALRARYASRQATPTDVVAAIYDALAAGPLHPVWISLVPRETALACAAALERDPLATAKPLYGVPFAIKDNIDLAGLPTTAGCPAYAYRPEASATVVQSLVDAGAIAIGKTNLDQFATGLVGTRSPYGACASVFDSRYISGGSSSGSAVAVAKGLASFSLGTDTAGSGRVPAAFNGLIGLKPTRGALSTSGVVPACRTLDCVSIFAGTAHDAHTVWQVARGFDPLDPFSRAPAPGQDAAPWLGGPFRFGVPAANQLEFFGDEEAQGLYWKAVADIERLGGRKVEIDFSIFRAAGDLLYSGPWVAERLAAIAPFLERHADEMDPVVRKIIAGGSRYQAVEAFQAEYRLRELRRAAEAEWARMDTLVLPTTGTIYTH
ncbi:MAG TPA: allophanate hydrolase, partial [Candidatus Solibacter sp.]|nr:allophanate hydrolase [Candidatus Solibacter sp.]